MFKSFGLGWRRFQGLIIPPGAVFRYPTLISTRLKMSSSDDGPKIDAATAQKLVKEFEGISNTDEIFAQFMLQVNLSKYYPELKTQELDTFNPDRLI